MDAAPGNIEYDSTQKAFVILPSFRRTFVLASGPQTWADQYLLQAASILTGAIQPADTWFGSTPPITVIEQIQRSVDPFILRTLLRAMEGRREVEIEYLSLTSSRKRGVVPHSLAFNGTRWHVRAWCVDRKDFRDFVLTRMLDANPETKPSDADPNDDLEWNTFIELRIAADPRLDADQRAAIERDNGMTNGEARIRTRAAFAYYVMRDMLLDRDMDQIPPMRRQLSLVNRDEVEQQIREARAATEARLAEKHPAP
jgi:predicted DNA-binding transcriptional regulator YafY